MALGRAFVLVVAVALLGTLVALPQSTESAEASSAEWGDRVRGRWIVDLADGVDPSDVAPQVARDHRGRAADIFEDVIGGFLFSGPDSAADALRRDRRVEHVHPDLRVRASVELTPTGVRRIQARHPNRPDAQELMVNGKGVRVAILDTGIDPHHVDLGVSGKLRRDCVGGGALRDPNGHGTHVAGTVSATANGKGVVGVAPNVRLVSVRVLDSRGVGSVSSIICGVNYLTRLATDGGRFNDVLIANMSLNGRGSPGHCNDGGLREAICRSARAGVLYVASAGNSDRHVGHEFPGNYPEVLAVSAYTDFDGWPSTHSRQCRTLFRRRECDDTLWTRSNFGGKIRLTAPGVLIHSTRAGGGKDVRTGTSHSAPHVAGVAALIRELRPDWGPVRMWNHMMETGDCPDGRQNGRAGNCRGQGRWGSDPDGLTEPLVNARRAVAELR